MVLCAYGAELLPGSFFGVWAVLLVAGTATITLMSGLSFIWLYGTPKFEKWQYKSSGRYPSVGYVRKEIYQTYKGIFFATMLPALSMHLRNESYMSGYCSGDLAEDDLKNSYYRLLGEFLLVIALTDFFEFFYHWCGHYFDHGWNIHRHHHVYSNPTPWAVIADEPFDNVVRASPMLWLPYFFELNLDLVFVTFGVFFYAYGTYLHSGYEADWIVPSDHWLVNTSFQHYVHHARGTRSRPCHCGFFVKLWDDLWGTQYDGPECFARTERAKGKRSHKVWEQEVLPAFPNYALLLSPKFLWFGDKHPDFAGKLTLDLRDSVSTTASDDSTDDSAPKSSSDGGDAAEGYSVNGNDGGCIVTKTSMLKKSCSTDSSRWPGSRLRSR